MLADQMLKTKALEIVLEKHLRPEAVRARKTRLEVSPREVVRFVEVEEKSERPEVAKSAGKYRLGFGSGAWLEIEGSFEREKVRELVKIRGRDPDAKYRRVDDEGVFGGWAD